MWQLLAQEEKCLPHQRERLETERFAKTDLQLRGWMLGYCTLRWFSLSLGGLHPLLQFSPDLAGPEPPPRPTPPTSISLHCVSLVNSCWEINCCYHP